MTRFYLLFALALVSYSLPAQFDQVQIQEIATTTDQVNELAATITVKDLKRHLNVLAADDMEGRETGQPGQKRAAEYLKGEFKRLP